jgi:SAM-dependent methyltransferase
MASRNAYNEDYYENGAELKISGYQNYRWLPEQTKSMCSSIVDFAGIERTNSVLDFGCAKGFIVRAMNDLGYDCYGGDISEYAISRSHESIKERLTLLDPERMEDWFLHRNFDIVLCKDVLEHIPYESIDSLLSVLRRISPRLLAIIPLGENGKYVIPDYENDVTHVIRENHAWWHERLRQAGFNDIRFEHKVRGIKENWSHYPTGNGFFLCGASNG